MSRHRLAGTPADRSPISLSSHSPMLQFAVDSFGVENQSLLGNLQFEEWYRRSLKLMGRDCGRRSRTLLDGERYRILRGSVG